MIRLKPNASVIQTALQMPASFSDTICALRWKMPRSMASIARTKRLNPIHKRGVPILNVLLPKGACAPALLESRLTTYHEIVPERRRQQQASTPRIRRGIFPVQGRGAPGNQAIGD